MMNRDDLRKIIDNEGLYRMKKYTIRRLSKEEIHGCHSMKRTHDFGTYLMLLWMIFPERYDDDGYGSYPGSNIDDNYERIYGEKREII